jgi:hypothetical protein
MQKTLTWVLGGVAVILSAGAAMAGDPTRAKAAHDPHETLRQAAEEARAASDRAREAADAAREASEKVRREVRVYRSGAGKEAAGAHRGGDRSERLRTLLQLRPEQEAALRAYVEALGKGGHKEHMVHFDRGDQARTTTERLAEMESRMAEQQAAMKRRIEATKAFYVQLDEKQRKVFDAMPMLMFAGPGFGPLLIPVADIKAPLFAPRPPEPPRAPRS